MKNLFIFLITAYSTLSIALCFGQELSNENGLILTYKIGGKIGSRYDEYCKITFDIYPVEGTLVNSNTDKAAVVSAILHFEGQTCNKIYSNDNNTTGELINKIFSLDIWGQSGRPSHYLVNRYVHLLPTQHMTAKGQVEVKEGEKVQEPDKYFTYELVPVVGNASEKMSEDSNDGTNTIKSTDGSSNWSQIIVGEWTITSQVFLFTDGKEKESSEPPQSVLFKDDGTGVNIGGNGEFKYAIQGNKMVWVLADDSQNVWDIVKLDASTFIMRYDYDDKDETGLASVVLTYSKTTN